ncbi:MAG TPA: uracil-DNA glycosylase [bacterium]|nr:uracil-DNA glycosylase [bacterium]
MTDPREQPGTEPPGEEIARLGDRLRSAVEIQGILRDEPVAASGRSAPRKAAGKAAAAKPAAPKPAAAKPAAPKRPAPAARAAAPPPDSPAPAAKVRASSSGEPAWQKDPSSVRSLGALHDAYAECQRCPLGETRTKFVFGVGNPKATVMFIGEAPGRDEDLQGEPFVGRAGQLLDKILEAIEWSRKDVYIANILKCRPPGNRNPEPPEVAACEPILRRQIQLIDPLILCTLGSVASKTLLDSKLGITKLRGTLHEYRGIPVVTTYHPAALLRNPNWKRPTWEDVQMLRREHDRLLKESGRAPA